MSRTLHVVTARNTTESSKMVKLIKLTDLLFFRFDKTLKDPLEVAQSLLKIVCSDPREKNRILIFIGNIFRLYIVILAILSAINLFYSTDIWMFASTFEGFMVAVQVGSKCCLAMEYFCNLTIAVG